MHTLELVNGFGEEALKLLKHSEFIRQKKKWKKKRSSKFAAVAVRLSKWCVNQRSARTR